MVTKENPSRTLAMMLLALENVAQIAISGYDANRAAETTPAPESVNDAIRDALMKAGVELAKFEDEHPTVWDAPEVDNDWRTVCEEIAEKLNEGEAIDAAWVKARLT